MKTTTGITLVAIGAVLCFAISLHPGFISPQIVGVILMLTGITGLCLRHHGLLDRQLGRLRDLLGQDANLAGGKRVALEDLLRTAGAATAPTGRPDSDLRGNA